jgi:hypothetical protein
MKSFRHWCSSSPSSFGLPLLQLEPIRACLCTLCLCGWCVHGHPCPSRGKARPVG